MDKITGQWQWYHYLLKSGNLWWVFLGKNLTMVMTATFSLASFSSFFFCGYLFLYLLKVCIENFSLGVEIQFNWYISVWCLPFNKLGLCSNTADSVCLGSNEISCFNKPLGNTDPAGHFAKSFTFGIISMSCKNWKLKLVWPEVLIFLS